MKIVANRILTRWEIDQQRVPSDGLIKMELGYSIGYELAGMKPLYTKEEIEGNVEHRIEAIVLGKDTFHTLMTQLRGLLSKEQYERIELIFKDQL